ncbi:hypothetical protein [Sphingomonas panni]|uniref:hypothetical protein n=1 Tax=Sphingomonas panni TaxID=237612 RepID=UPI001F5B453B|nr:hypothetical protein [Sphingomonas panni]
MSALVTRHIGVPGGNDFCGSTAAQRIWRKVRSPTLSFSRLPPLRCYSSRGVVAMIRSAASVGVQCSQSSATAGAAPTGAG